MAVDVAVPAARVRARAFALPVRTVLGGMIAVSFVLRWVLARAHETPYYFPDEYLYPTLAHAIATTGRPAVRGEAASFPALLEPLLTAPLWLPGDVGLAYALTQGLHALAMSLGAIPIFLLARKLGLGERWSLGAAALTLAAPALGYAGFMLADPVAYPLVLAAVCAGVYALDRPSARSQLAFLAFSGLATFARVQFVVLPALFLVAALVVDGRRAFRAYRVLLACLGVPLLAVVAVGLDRALGYYSVLGESELPVVDILRWLGSDAMVVAYASGWLIVPGALLGLAVGLLRPASRAERGFAALAALLGLALIGQAAFYSANAVSDAAARVHERYTFALVPLVGVAFLVYARRGFPWRGALAGLAAGMFLLSVRVPLSGYTIAQGKDDSPTLRAVLRLEHAIGLANGSLAVAAAAGLLSLGAAALALRHRRGAPLAVAATLLVLAGIAAGSASFDRQNSRVVLAEQLPNGRDWVDRRGLGSVTLVQLPGADRHAAFEQLFWNRSVERVVLTGSAPIDAFAATGAGIADDGRLRAGTTPVRGPLLLQTWGSYVRLSGVELLDRTPMWELVRPDGDPRFEVLAPGFHADGWLAREAAVTLWPDRSGRVEGTLTLRFSLPANAKRTRFDLEAPELRRRLVVEPGGTTEVVLPVSSRGPWTLSLRARDYGWLGNSRQVSVQFEPPQFERS